MEAGAGADSRTACRRRRASARQRWGLGSGVAGLSAHRQICITSNNCHHRITHFDRRDARILTDDRNANPVYRSTKQDIALHGSERTRLPLDALALVVLRSHRRSSGAQLVGRGKHRGDGSTCRDGYSPVKAVAPDGEKSGSSVCLTKGSTHLESTGGGLKDLFGNPVAAFWHPGPGLGGACGLRPAAGRAGYFPAASRCTSAAASSAPTNGATAI